jgi:hypothetical protein
MQSFSQQYDCYVNAKYDMMNKFQTRDTEILCTLGYKLLCMFLACNRDRLEASDAFPADT